jgi:electron transport complex protein RnfG
MSSVAEPSLRKPASHQAGLLGGFAMVAAALLVAGNLMTKEAIEQRRTEDLLASLDQVIRPVIHDNDLLAYPILLPQTSGATVTVYRALKGAEVTGVAFPISTDGYAGPIDLILGLNARGEILGARALAHSETPGLGDKIDARRDDWILGFDGLSLGNPPAERWAVKKDGGDFDQFSGATITPRAVVAAIKEGLELFAEHRDTLLASEVIQESPSQRAAMGSSPGGLP